MKFILNEHKKFLLEERPASRKAILTEASAADVAKQWSDQLTSVLDTARDILTEYNDVVKLSDKKATKQSKFDDLKANIEKATSELENSLDLPYDTFKTNGFESLKQEVENYWLALGLTEEDPLIREVIKDSDEGALLNKWLKDLEAIEKLSTANNGWDEANFNKLKEIFEKVNKTILPLLDTSDITADTSKIKKFKDTCVKSIGLITKIKTSLPKDFSKFNDIERSELQDYRKTIQQIIETSKLDKAETLTVGDDDSFETYISKVEAFKQACTAFMELPMFSTDWKAKYADAADKQAIVKAFMYKIWPNAAEADKVLKIIEPFELECDSYGFSQENPFVHFISEVYLKYGMSAEAYNVVHNQVAKGNLQVEDLVPNNQNLGLVNIIFCKAFYQLGTTNMKQYVLKQKALRGVSLPPEIESHKELVYKVLYKVASDAQIQDLSKLSAVDKTLNAFPELEAREKEFTGKVSETAVADIEKKKAKKNISNPAIISQIKTTENAVQLLAALAMKFGSAAEIADTIKNYKKVSDFMKQSSTVLELQKLVARVENLYNLKSINVTQAQSLVKSILEADEFDLN